MRPRGEGQEGSPRKSLVHSHRPSVSLTSHLQLDSVEPCRPSGRPTRFKPTMARTALLLALPLLLAACIHAQTTGECSRRSATADSCRSQLPQRSCPPRCPVSPLTNPGTSLALQMTLSSAPSTSRPTPRRPPTAASAGPTPAGPATARPPARISTGCGAAAPAPRAAAGASASAAVLREFAGPNAAVSLRLTICATDYLTLSPPPGHHLPALCLPLARPLPASRRRTWLTAAWHSTATLLAAQTHPTFSTG